MRFFTGGIFHTYIKKYKKCKGGAIVLNKIYDLFIIGMDVKVISKKVYKGFDGEFDESDESDYKYFLYFKTFYNQYYCVAVYTLEEIDRSNWIPVTKGCIEIRQINELPPMQYIITEPTDEYINLNDYQQTKTITNSYLDFSKYGNNYTSPNGYAIINFNKFKNASNINNAIPHTESKVDDVIKSFYSYKNNNEQLIPDVDNILNDILSDSSDIEWQHQCLIRKQGLYGSSSSNEQLSK